MQCATTGLVVRIKNTSTAIHRPFFAKEWTCARCGLRELSADGTSVPCYESSKLASIYIDRRAYRAGVYYSRRFFFGATGSVVALVFLAFAKFESIGAVAEEGAVRLSDKTMLPKRAPSGCE